MLGRIDDIQRTAGAIHKNAATISNECGAFVTGIERLLSRALSALSSPEVEVDTGSSDAVVPAEGAA